MPEGQTENSVRAAVLSCVRGVLRGVVRLCLRSSIHFQDLSEELKRVYVSVAKEELGLGGGQASLSRLSVMTGVHRKDVTRFERDGNVAREKTSLISRVMVQWQHDGRFSTKAKRPRVLDACGRDGEFAALVRSVCGEDVSHYAVLHEMERLGAVERAGDRARLVWRDFVVSDDIEAGLRMLAQDSDDLVAAVEENLFEGAADGVKNLHLKTEFDNVRADKVPEIRAWILNEGSLFHRRVREYVAGFDVDLNPELAAKSPGTSGGRVVVGAFSICSDRSEKI